MGASAITLLSVSPAPKKPEQRTRKTWSFLGNCSVNKFPRLLACSPHHIKYSYVVTDSRRLVLPRNSFIILSLQINCLKCFHPLYCARVDSNSNSNEFQEPSWGLKGGQHVILTNSALPVSQLSKKYDSLKVSKPYGAAWTVTGIAVYFCFLPRCSIIILSPFPPDHTDIHKNY